MCVCVCVKLYLVKLIVHWRAQHFRPIKKVSVMLYNQNLNELDDITIDHNDSS